MKTHTPRAPVSMFELVLYYWVLRVNVHLNVHAYAGIKSPHHSTHTNTLIHTHTTNTSPCRVGTNCSCLKEFLPGSSQPWHTSSFCLLNLVAAHDLQSVWPQGVISSCMLTSSLPQKRHGVFVMLFLLLFKDE
jgi:hypothetical protein